MNEIKVAENKTLKLTNVLARKIEAEDIPRAGRLMYVTTVLMLLVFGGIKLLICLL